MRRAESRGRLLQRRWRFLAMRLLVVGVTIGGFATTVPAGNPSDRAHPPASSNESPTRERRPAGSAEDPAPVLVRPDQPNVIAFPPRPARLVRLVIHAAQGEPCIDELEIYGPAGKDNLALAKRGASADRLFVPRRACDPSDPPSERWQVRQRPKLDCCQRHRRVGSNRIDRACGRGPSGLLP